EETRQRGSAFRAGEQVPRALTTTARLHYAYGPVTCAAFCSTGIPACVVLALASLEPKPIQSGMPGRNACATKHGYTPAAAVSGHRRSLKGASASNTRFPVWLASRRAPFTSLHFTSPRRRRGTRGC